VPCIQQMQERLDAFKPFNKWEVRERARANMPRYTISEIFEKKFDNIHHRNDNGSPRATYNRRQVYHDVSVSARVCVCCLCVCVCCLCVCVCCLCVCVCVAFIDFLSCDFLVWLW